MPSLKLHIKTALIASAVALALLVVSFLVISAEIASQIQDNERTEARLQAESLAKTLSLFPDQSTADDLDQLTNLVGGSRPNLVTARVWKLENGDFVEQAASDDSLPTETIPGDVKTALLTDSASQTVDTPQKNSNEPLYRIFTPIVIKNKLWGAVEVVERLDTVSTIAMRYAGNLVWIVVATILLMTAAFYLLFQNLVYEPLEKILSAMDTAKTGNLSAEITENLKQDEFGRVSANFNSMMSQIREMTAEREHRSEILEEKVRAATVELTQKNEQLETANLELFRTTRRMTEMERLAAAGQTAAQFAHEVGTPLNLISGHVQLLQSSMASDSKAATRLRTISAQIERIEQIVREMLDRTRFGASEHVALNLNELLRKFLDALEPTLEKNRVALTANLAPALPPVAGDANRLQQVFLNLVNNALDAMPEGGKLTVSTACEDGEVIVEFADDGLGMSRETSAKIFQPLFTTKERGRGTGLGLVVVKQILQEHEATIAVASAPGKGAKFSITFKAEKP
ncbi:MAG: HAMP domain-containing protein [Acidobacteria bacterium]|nr:HAMP domain-containing protein [Acidobacteriota bacterium]